MLDQNRVDNIIATIDVNGKQIDGSTDDVLHMGDLQEKFEAFGWKVISIKNGNDITSIIEGMKASKKRNK